MKILFLCHRLPYPPKRGGKIRPFNMIRHLSRRHEVTVATLAALRAAELAEGRELSRYCHELHVGRDLCLRRLGSLRLYGLRLVSGHVRLLLFPGPGPDRPPLARDANFERDPRRTAPRWGPTWPAIVGCRKIMDFGDADSEKWLEYARACPFPAFAGVPRGTKGQAATSGGWARGFDACSVNAPGSARS